MGGGPTAAREQRDQGYATRGSATLHPRSHTRIAQSAFAEHWRRRVTRLPADCPSPRVSAVMADEALVRRSPAAVQAADQRSERRARRSASISRIAICALVRASFADPRQQSNDAASRLRLAVRRESSGNTGPDDCYGARQKAADSGS
jgi:hypothetical protein